MSTHRGLLHHLMIFVASVERSSPFYAAIFKHLGYNLAGEDTSGQDWKRWDLDTPRETSICQVSAEHASISHCWRRRTSSTYAGSFGGAGTVRHRGSAM